MVSRNHDNLNSGRLAFLNSEGHRVLGRVHQRDQSQECEAFHAEVESLNGIEVELGSLRIFGARQVQLSKSKHSFSISAEGEVDLFELLGGLLVDGLVASLDEQVRAEGPELFWCALDVDAEVRVVGFPINYAKGEFVRRVEGHFGLGAVW